MRAQLKSIIIMSRGMGAWDELLKTEGEIRKKRQRMIYEQKERQRQVIEWTAIVIGIAISGSFLVWLIGLFNESTRCFIVDSMKWLIAYFLLLAVCMVSSVFMVVVKYMNQKTQSMELKKIIQTNKK